MPHNPAFYILRMKAATSSNAARSAVTWSASLVQAGAVYVHFEKLQFDGFELCASKTG